MGGGDWEKEQSSVSLMPDSALCAEDRLSKVMLKIKSQILRFSSDIDAEMLSFSLNGYKLTFLGEFGLFSPQNCLLG